MRSRLEARWAVFFDSLGLEWEYEPEGFETSAGRYLPDFRVNDRWYEVKPNVDAITGDEWSRMEAFGKSAPGGLTVLIGLPGSQLSYPALDEWTDRTRFVVDKEHKTRRCDDITDKNFTVRYATAINAAHAARFER